jgi:glycogen debranching enzyme
VLAVCKQTAAVIPYLILMLKSQPSKKKITPSRNLFSIANSVLCATNSYTLVLKYFNKMQTAFKIKVLTSMKRIFRLMFNAQEYSFQNANNSSAVELLLLRADELSGLAAQCITVATMLSFKAF